MPSNPKAKGRAAKLTGTQQTKTKGTKATSKAKVTKKTPVKKTPAAPTPEPPAELTPAELKFQKALEDCSVQERIFLMHKLGRKNNTEAALLAEYSPHTAEVQGARLLGRVRVWRAYQAGLEAAGFGAAEVLDDIRALREFDRSQIEREVKREVDELIEVPVEEVVQELLVREKALDVMLSGLDKDENEDLVKTLKGRLRALLKERLGLQEDLAVNPAATVIRRRRTLITDRVIDYDLARERGLLRFIKGRRPTKYGDVVEVHDWVDGVEMGGRAHGVFKDRKVLENPDGSAVNAGVATVIVLPNNGRDPAPPDEEDASS
ncbi:hypothetical protein [Deinococcus soli (ex Cha et al. 2016)]|uniref:hypothetical protein n=1 Tax=Deinococcus soli (ex Cha et al. 2016) TaxID=1309411 RepID=UPI00166C6A8B|nr:hypothetical protein [Deinococcus soli (ex Cha et al. 2016)]GGB69401.1 hypothetical protein GCM10008019_26980 [Deinococcus soli (ex Cha et al. 2016)]